MLRIIAFLILTLTLSATFAQDKPFTLVNNTKVVEEKIIDASKSMHSLTSDFKQEKKLEYLETTIVSEGKFWFKDGNKLRWEYSTPFNYIIAICDGKFMINDEGKTTVFDTKSNQAFKELNDILMSTVNGTLISSGKFNFSLSENNNAYLVKLEPKATEMKSVLSNIHLFFSKKDLTVYQVKMIETPTDYTLITFTNKKVNTAIDEGVFKLN